MRTSPWHTTPDGAMACQTFSSKFLQPQKATLHYWKGIFGNWQRPAAAWQQWDAVHNKRGFPIQQIECAFPCCAQKTHSRAAKKPLAVGLPATPALAQLQSLALPRRQLQSQPPDCPHGHLRGLGTTLAVGESRGFLWNRSSSSASWELHVLLF